MNKDIDATIDAMQKKLMKQRAKYPFISLGGPDGMRLARAAFAVTVKFSDSLDEFEDLMDAIKDSADAVDEYPEVLKRWEQASRMRQWIN
jgi:hypothetical protein